MSRDWQKDMELLQQDEWSFEEMVDICGQVAPYWHSEAEKWRVEAFRKYPTPEAYEAACAALHKHRERADKAEAELAQLQSDFNYITSVKDSHKKRLEEWGNRALESEAREKKLREAAEKCINIFWEVTISDEKSLESICDTLTDVLASLYPKEENK